MNRTVVATVPSLCPLLVSLTLLVSANEPASTDLLGPVPIEAILTSPGQYGEKEVLIRGVVVEKSEGVFPNGRPYSTLSIGDGRGTITVFSWDRPPVDVGDPVEVVGIFHIWRYNFRHIIETRRITRSVPR